MEKNFEVNSLQSDNCLGTNIGVDVYNETNKRDNTSPQKEEIMHTKIKPSDINIEPHITDTSKG